MLTDDYITVVVTIYSQKGFKKHRQRFLDEPLIVGKEAAGVVKSQPPQLNPRSLRFLLCWRCKINSKCGYARRAAACFFTAVCLGIVNSGSSRQIVLQTSVPSTAFKFTSTLSFLYMTEEKQILPACRCAWWNIKFGSIQLLICQAESPSPLPPFFFF